MQKLRAITLFVIPFLCWGALTIRFMSQGNVWAATLAALPFVALLLLVMFPSSGPGHFAFSHEFGPVKEEDETERQYAIKMAKWWFVGSLSLPLSMALAFMLEKYQGVAATTMFLGIIFGIPCLLKCLGSLYQAARAKG